MQADFLSGGTFATTVAGLTATGGVNTFSTANVLHYSIDGDAFTKAAVTNAATPTVDVVSGKAITLTAGNAIAVAWGINDAGNFFVIGSKPVVWDGGTVAPSFGFGNQVPETPQFERPYAMFAITMLKASSALVGTWTFGTSLWNATGLTVAHHNVLLPPPRPFLK